MKQLVISVKRDVVNKVFPHLLERGISPLDGELGMFKSGAKLYMCTRKGDYRISGYSHDGEDVVKAVRELFSV